MLTTEIKQHRRDRAGPTHQDLQVRVLGSVTTERKDAHGTRPLTVPTNCSPRYLATGVALCTSPTEPVIQARGLFPRHGELVGLDAGFA